MLGHINQCYFYSTLKWSWGVQHFAGVVGLFLRFFGFGVLGGFWGIFFFLMSKTCICALVPNFLTEKIIRSTIVLVWEQHLGRRLPVAVLHPLQLYWSWSSSGEGTGCSWGRGRRNLFVQVAELQSGGRGVWLSYSSKAVCLLLHLCAAWGAMWLSTSWKIPDHNPLSFTGPVSVWWFWPEPVLVGCENLFSHEFSIQQHFWHSKSFLSVEHTLFSRVGQPVRVPLWRWAGRTEGQELS